MRIKEKSYIFAFSRQLKENSLTISGLPSSVISRVIKKSRNQKNGSTELKYKEKRIQFPTVPEMFYSVY